MRISRPFFLALVLSIVLAALLWSAALAQTDTAPAPGSEDMEPSAYLTLDTQAGFALDPFLVSLNGGGEVDASTLDPACVGYINDRPVMTANWRGEAEFLRIFFYSDSDSTLVIQRPDGSYICADDIDENLLDAELTAENPEPGMYKIWVGSYNPEQLIPGLLVITGRPKLSHTSFDLAALVARKAIVAEAVEPSELEEAARKAITDTVTNVADSLISAETTVTATIVASGLTPSFEVSGEGAVCGGMVGDEADFIIDIEEGVEAVRIMFEAEQDASLLVMHADADPACADDDTQQLNANPVLDLQAPAPGLYGIFVGRFQHEEPITGTLTITTDPTLQPAILAPAANPQE